ncbi:hypothetical protein KUP33_003856 [Salmonella enterica]|uniref:hypothetical protein n=1 Tax=Salmonella enterica TaxID=28901 RepID=UPI00111B15E7|nr:hypothetical protein [Salmonella enterica]EAQ2736410.1 hypothetical protein [Salmonella enterica]EEC7118335.1 hypothetical protein [Salmonella enterica]EEN0113808.1 hypothetical protein [Salmonella enterica]EGI5826917.1 hypothetical protein [Salmonella enterica subsp. enterica serovar Urbana]EHR8414971.1 hypothetical protein [Salmonella enterica]
MNNKKQNGIIMVATVMTSLFLNSRIANAELIQNTVSVVCAQSYTKGEDSGNPKTLNLKHCNKINGDWEVNSHSHYAKHNKDVNENFIGAQGDTNDKLCAGKLDNYSLVYHINDYFIKSDNLELGALVAGVEYHF